MKIYLYDSKTFEYIKSEEAALDPEVTKHLGRPVYVIPKNATKVAVPELKENELAVYNEKAAAWEVLSCDTPAEELSETAQELQNKKNIIMYQLRIAELEEKYNKVINTPVSYKKFLYLPRYAEKYRTLLGKKFPMTIWDCEGKCSKEVNEKELLDITLHLEDICEKAYQKKREALKKCYVELAKLQGE